MKKILIVTAVALASALFLTNCNKEDGKGKCYGLSEKELGEIFEVAETMEEMTGTPDASPTGHAFIQALQAITGKQPTPYYKDTVKMKGDTRSVVRSYDEANLQGVLHFYEGTELQIKDGTGTPVEEFSLQFAKKYKSVVTQEMLQTVKESTVDGSGIFEFTIPTTKAGDMQEKVSKIYLRQLKSIVQVHPDIPNTDTEIPIKSTSGE